MATFGTGEIDRGSIAFSPAHPHAGAATVFFVPTAQTLQYLRPHQDKTREPVKLLEFDSAQSRVSIYPIKHTTEARKLRPTQVSASAGDQPSTRQR